MIISKERNNCFKGNDIIEAVNNIEKAITSIRLIFGDD